jgi:hypothetical protein
MLQRHFLFLVVCLLMFCAKIIGQKNPQNFRDFITCKTLRVSNLHLAVPETESILPRDMPLNTNFRRSADLTIPAIPGHFSLVAQPVLTSSFYCNSLGFFCKKELQLEKITSLPVRLRLGSVDYVNYLEQKPNTVKF